jgi:hypothetical protein
MRNDPVRAFREHGSLGVEPRTDTGRGRGVLQHRPAGSEGYLVISSVEAGDPVRLARGYGRTGPPALVTTSRPRTVRGNGGRGRRFHLAPAGMRLVDRTELGSSSTAWRAVGCGASPPATRCSYAARHTEQGAFCCRQRDEHTRQLPRSSGSCAASMDRQPSVRRGSSDRATDSSDGASAWLASSESMSRRSHTASRRTWPSISST